MRKYKGAVGCGFGKHQADGDELRARGCFLRSAGRWAAPVTTQQVVIVDEVGIVEEFFVVVPVVVGIGAECFERSGRRFPHCLGAKGTGLVHSWFRGHAG